MRYLCVSRQQHASLCRDAVFRVKSDFIFNPIVSKAYPAGLGVATSDDVVYMGSLVKSKGFHILSQCWSDVVDDLRVGETARGRVWTPL